MEKTRNLSPSESLDIISKAIHQTKDNIKDQSFYYILWGWLISMAALLNYVFVAFTDFRPAYLPWMILVPAGWMISIIYSVKMERTKKYETYFELFLKYLWIVLGVTFIIAVNMSLWLKINPTIFVLLLTGVGTLVSGLTMKFKPLSIGGVLFFAFAIASLFANYSQTLLITSIAVVTGYLIPAYLLKKSK